MKLLIVNCLETHFLDCCNKRIWCHENVCNYELYHAYNNVRHSNDILLDIFSSAFLSIYDNESNKYE